MSKKVFEPVAEGPTADEKIDNIKTRLASIEDAIAPEKEPEPKVVDKSFYYVCTASCTLRQIGGSDYPCSDGNPYGIEAATVIRTDRWLPGYLTDGHKRGRPNAKSSVKFRLVNEDWLKAKSQGVELEDWSD